MFDIQFWATVASPIVGVAAIIAALIISYRSSQDAQRQIDEIRKSTKKQIDALHEQQELFMAAQAPDMAEALDTYKQQLAQIDRQIAKAQQDYEIVNPFYGRGPRIEDIEYESKKRGQKQNLDQLKQQRKKIVHQIKLIESFLAKS